jgi:hypothetical protein
VEIRLGGIYALERITNELEKDYWSIMEVLTAYVRKNSSVDSLLKKNKIAIKAISINIQTNESINKEYSKIKKPLDIPAIITVIGKGINFLNNGKFNSLNLQMTCL